MTESQTTEANVNTENLGEAVSLGVVEQTGPTTAQQLLEKAVNSVRVLEDPPARADTAAADSAERVEGDAGDDHPTPVKGSRRAPAPEQLVAEGDAAGDYLERLLDILDFDGDIDLDVEGERAVVSIIGDSHDIDKLVGDHGEVLDALQELTRLAATAQTGQRSRLMLDVAGYRVNRRKELSELGSQTAHAVLESGEPARMAPMNPFERKVVHDAVAEIDGVQSASDGEEPQRRVVISRTS